MIRNRNDKKFSCKDKGRHLEPIQDLRVCRMGGDFSVLQGKKTPTYFVYDKFF